MKPEKLPNRHCRSELDLVHLTPPPSFCLLGRKSGNGNITLLIEDVNDNVPMIVPGTYLTLCEGEDGQMGSVTIEAEDADLSPYARPFNFMLPEGHDGKWRLRDIQSE